MELKWKKQLFEIFSTASWTATAVSKRQLISCHTKWEKTTMMLLYGMQTQNGQGFFQPVLSNTSPLSANTTADMYTTNCFIITYKTWARESYPPKKCPYQK